MFDNLEDGHEAWHVCRSGWCAGQVDHMSCSLINHELPALFGYGVGFVLAPATEFVCGYSYDGGTQGRYMGGCYDWPRCSPSQWWECAWGPDQVGDAIATQITHGNRNGYNEYIVSREHWEAQLPDLIEAVMCRDDCGRARQVHEAFLQAYGRSRWQTPLVFYENGFSVI